MAIIHFEEEAKIGGVFIFDRHHHGAKRMLHNQAARRLMALLFNITRRCTSGRIISRDEVMFLGIGIVFTFHSFVPFLATYLPKP